MEGKVNGTGARWFDAGLVMAALGLGLALTQWPVMSAAIIGLGGIIVAAILVEPLIGLGLTLLAAPFSAWERFTWGLPLDSGQVLLMVTLGAWLLRGLARRELPLPAPGQGGEKRFPHAPLLLPLLIFTGTAALSLLNAASISAGLKELLKWVQMIAVYWLVTTVERPRLPWLVGMVLLSALLQAGLGVWQFALRGSGPAHFWIGGALYRAYGTFHQPNPFGGYIGLTLPIAFGLLISDFRNTPPGPDPRRERSRTPGRRDVSHLMPYALRSALCASCLLLLAGLVSSWSRGAWLGALAALAAMVAVWPRRWWLGVSVVVVIAGLILGGSVAGVLPGVLRARLADLTQYIQIYDVRGVGVNDANYAVIERLAHWQAAYEMIRWHLWTGVGLGNYETAYATYHLLNWPYPLGHAHNYFLNITAETGLPGLLAYVLLWGAVFGQTFRALRKTTGWSRGLMLGLVGVWVHLHIHNLFDNLYVSNLWIHLAVLLGMIRTDDE